MQIGRIVLKDASITFDWRARIRAMLRRVYAEDIPPCVVIQGVLEEEDLELKKLSGKHKLIVHLEVE